MPLQMNPRRETALRFSIACLVFGLAGNSDVLHASSAVVLDVGPGVEGEAAYNCTLGYDFVVGLDPILVSDLGIFDTSGNGLVNSHPVGLWDTNGTLLASVTLDAGTSAPLSNQFRYGHLESPIMLSAGTRYILGAGYKVFDEDHLIANFNGNQASYDPAVTGNDARYSLGGGFTFPASNSPSGSDLGPNAIFAVVQTTNNGPIILRQPLSQTANAGIAVSFSVVADGSGALSYQWLKDGIGLSDGPDCSGVAAPTLTLSNVLGGAAGQYSVTVTSFYGSVTSAVATLTVVDPIITLQPTNLEIHTGQSASFAVGAFGTAPLAYQWFFNGAPMPGATDSSNLLTNVPDTNAAGSYFAVVSNAFGMATSQVATLLVDVATADAFNPGADSNVTCLLPMTDGTILAGGQFTVLGGQPRLALAHLNSAGSVDTNYMAGAVGGDFYTAPILCLAIQPGGKVLVGGGFTNLAGQEVDRIGRLNPDGTLDTSFNPGVSDPTTDIPPYVSALGLQTNGQVIVAGRFTMCGGQPRAHIARLNSDGTLDTNFDPGYNDNNNHPPYEISAVAVEPDGRILVGGYFTHLAGQLWYCLGRLNADGSLDSGFNPGFVGGTRNPNVSCFALQPDGALLVGGYFFSIGSQVRSCLCRVNSDGSLDETFDPEPNGAVNSITLQTDGKILVAGSFSSLGGRVCYSIGRLNSDGSLDNSFSPGVNGDVKSLSLQTDGEILLGGAFSSLVGQQRSNLGRLDNFGVASGQLVLNGSALTWLRGGTSPEVWRTTFEFSMDGTTWVDLGVGARATGGWQLARAAVPPGATVRARGYTNGGLNNGSSWFLETSLQTPPALQLLNAKYGSTGFTFDITGPSNQNFVIETSSNLTDWLPLWTNTLSTQPVSFNDPNSKTAPGRFYRAHAY